MTRLDALRTDDFEELFSIAGTPEALRLLLRDRPEIRAIKEAITEGALTFEDLEAYVGKIVRDSIGGDWSLGDHTLSALAVILETSAAPFAREFVSQLASLRIQELPMASRVARHVAQHRATRIIETTSRDLSLATVGSSTGIPFAISKPLHVTLDRVLLPTG